MTRSFGGRCPPQQPRRKKPSRGPSKPAPPPQSHLETCFHSQRRTSFPLHTRRSRKLSCPRTAEGTRSHASIRRETNNTGFRKAHSLRKRPTAKLRPERIAARRCSANQA